MPNPYHDAEGKFASRDELKQRVADAQSRGDWDQYFVERKNLESIEMQIESDELFKKFEEKEPKTGIAVSDKHTYSEPTYTRADHDYYPVVTGSKFTGYQSASEISKKVRADLKEAQAKGYLPSHLKFRVFSDRYSGGQSVGVEILGVTDAQQYTTEPDGYKYARSEEAKKLADRVEKIRGAYNQSSSNPQIDYFSSTYNGTVQIENEQGKAFREKEAEKAKQKREVAKQKASLAEEYKTTGDLSVLSSPEMKYNYTTSDGIEFGKIPGTKFVAFRYPSPRDAGVYLNKVVDFSDFKEGRPNALEEELSKRSDISIRATTRKLRFIDG